jgi:hypothetical protein
VDQDRGGERLVGRGRGRERLVDQGRGRERSVDQGRGRERLVDQGLSVVAVQKPLPYVREGLTHSVFNVTPFLRLFSSESAPRRSRPSKINLG